MFLKGETVGAVSSRTGRSEIPAEEFRLFDFDVMTGQAGWTPATTSSFFCLRYRNA